ncbi:MAG: sigma-54 dependent transcriptional regulator [Nitrospirota bacterium]|nr:sigma-54 dependent transcriptional regulator [Nitrospirota bacterium]
MPLALIVDDDRNIRTVLKGMLEESGFSVMTSQNVEEALPIIVEQDLDLVITDLKMPGKSGMDLLAECRGLKPAVPVIMVTAFGDVEAAVSAIKRGAYDFITKPFDEDELLNVIKKALSESRKNRELVSAYFGREEAPLHDIIGRSDTIKEVLRTVRKVARTDSTVLITGETGVGKELIARAIHTESHRRDQPFIKVNCAAIPDLLLESELFGYERGAFTGAVTSKPGRFEIAHKGSLFLDEIGDMSLHLQAKLLSALQNRSFERVGGVKTIRVDMRIIAATNKDLQEAMRAGAFRQDLFYRLNVVPVRIPPLRERLEDIFPLTDNLVRKFGSRNRKTITGVSPQVMEAFSGYDWPGNIRELENVVERMVVMADADTLGTDLLPDEIRGTARTGESFRKRIESISRLTEKQMIIDALEKTGQNRTKAAELLGISRRTIQNKIKEYGLQA